MSTLFQASLSMHMTAVIPDAGGGAGGGPAGATCATPLNIPDAILMDTAPRATGLYQTLEEVLAADPRLAAGLLGYVRYSPQHAACDSHGYRSTCDRPVPDAGGDAGGGPAPGGWPPGLRALPVQPGGAGGGAAHRGPPVRAPARPAAASRWRRCVFELQTCLPS